MTQEDKELLLKDLCARLPYGVKCAIYITYERLTHDKETVFYVAGPNIVTLEGNDRNECYMYWQVKPYLRPMSSMTDEEYDQLYIDSRVKEDSVDILDAFANDLDAIDWLNAHHFDYRGLIPMGLAIEVTKENNPYV